MRNQPDDHATDSDDATEEPRYSEANGRSLPSFTTRDERITLMRCSVVRKFDEELFSLHFQSGDVKLNDLIIVCFFF